MGMPHDIRQSFLNYAITGDLQVGRQTFARMNLRQILARDRHAAPVVPANQRNVETNPSSSSIEGRKSSERLCTWSIALSTMLMLSSNRGCPAHPNHIQRVEIDADRVEDLSDFIVQFPGEAPPFFFLDFHGPREKCHAIAWHSREGPLRLCAFGDVVGHCHRE